jgi:hypothetical protein
MDKNIWNPEGCALCFSNQVDATHSHMDSGEVGLSVGDPGTLDFSLFPVSSPLSDNIAL